MYAKILLLILFFMNYIYLFSQKVHVIFDSVDCVKFKVYILSDSVPKMEKIRLNQKIMHKIIVNPEDLIFVEEQYQIINGIRYDYNIVDGKTLQWPIFRIRIDTSEGHPASLENGLLFRVSDINCNEIRKHIIWNEYKERTMFLGRFDYFSLYLYLNSNYKFCNKPKTFVSLEFKLRKPCFYCR